LHVGESSGDFGLDVGDSLVELLVRVLRQYSGDFGLHVGDSLVEILVCMLGTV
jgi:hypothetical protein